MTSPQSLPRRPETRADFEIAIICALTLEADAVEALFDEYWDDEASHFHKAPDDSNTYSTGAIGRHNVVLAYMPGMGKANAAAVALNCRASFPNIKLALVVGICGVVPSTPSGDEVVLGDVIISDGVIQHDFGRRYPDRFERKDTLSDSLGRPNTAIRSALSKLQGLRTRRKLASKMTAYLEILRSDPQLEAGYPGTAHDRLFEATYRHENPNMTCERMGCNGQLVARRRLQGMDEDPKPAVYFGLVASGDAVIKSGEDRDAIAEAEGVIAFEMEGAGVWDSFPCLVVKGACDYADSHKNKRWQRYAAATAAACTKAFLLQWVPTSPSSLSPPMGSPLMERPLTPTNSFSEHLEQPCGPWFLIPYPRNPAFVGRDEILNTVRRRLVPFTTARQPRVSLFGLGGIGKTQIALEYAHWLNQLYPDVSIFWADASSMEQLRRSYLSISQQCSIPGHRESNVDVLILVKTWLEKTYRGQWLMVLDNANDDEISPLIPHSFFGSVLLTTQNKHVGISLADHRDIVEVGAMSQEECNQLVVAGLEGLAVPDNEVALLASRLDFVPLGLVQATSYIRRHTMSVTRYLQLLDANDGASMDLIIRGFAAAGGRSLVSQELTAVLTSTLNRIKQYHTFASALLSLISLFGGQTIPLDFLFRYQNRQHHQDDDEQHQGGMQDAQLDESLGILKAFSLISIGDNSKVSVYWLVQLVTREWLRSERQLECFAAQAAVLLFQCYPLSEDDNATFFKEYLPYVQAVLQCFAEGAAVSYGSTQERIETASLLHRTASYLFSVGEHKNAGGYFRRAAETRKLVLGTEHPETLKTMTMLAWTLQRQGLLQEAEAIYVEVVEVRRRVLGEEHMDTTLPMYCLSLSSVENNGGDEADALVLNIVERGNEELSGRNLAMLATAGTTTVWDDSDQQNHWEASELGFAGLLEVQKWVLGEEHAQTLITSSRLVDAFNNQRRWELSEKIYSIARETEQRVFGEEHPQALGFVDCLSRCINDQGRLNEVTKMLTPLVDTMARVLGKEHPRTLSATLALASAMAGEDRSEEAEAMLQPVVEVTTRVNGEGNPQTVLAMSNLASVIASQGRLKEAEEMLRTLIEVGKRVHGEDGFHRLQDIASLSDILNQQGRGAEAEALTAPLVETMKRIYGEDDPKTLRIIVILGGSLQQQERWEESVALQRPVVEAMKRIYGEDDPQTLQSIITLSAMLRGQGLWEESRVLQEPLVEAMRRAHGEQDPQTLVEIDHLGLILRKQERWEECIALQRPLVEKMQKVYGEASANALRSVSVLSDVLCKCGRDAEAVKLELEQLANRKAVFGEGHANTLNNMKWLVRACRDLGQRDEVKMLKAEIKEIEKRARIAEEKDRVKPRWRDRISIIRK